MLTGKHLTLSLVPNLYEEQIFLVDVRLHLLLDKLLTEFKITNHEHLVQKPIEIRANHYCVYKRENNLIKISNVAYRELEDSIGEL